MKREYVEMTRITKEDGVKWKCSQCGYQLVHPISHEVDHRCPNDGTFMGKGILIRNYATTRHAPKTIKLS